jgi:glycosyltransferase involved in cell wall biosynthesis
VNTLTHPPVISVILPTYNNDQYLLSALKSILNQTFSDFELIVINDGSTDNTAKILSRIHDSRLKIITHQQNQGKVASCNQGINLAQGEFIARMDGDDLIHPQKFAAQVNYLRQHPQVVMVGTRMKRMCGRTYRYPLDHETIRTSFLVENVISQPSVMWRRAFFITHQLYYNPHFDIAEDYDLWTRVALVGQIANLPYVYHYYRWHKGQETQTKINQQRHNTAQIIYRQLKVLLPQIKAEKIIFLFDFSRPKTIADLQEVSDIFTQLLTRNRQKKLYQQNILLKVLANKYLSFCSNSAPDLRAKVWRLWQHSRWRKQYSGSHLRLWWFYFKCFIKPVINQQKPKYK